MLYYERARISEYDCINQTRSLCLPVAAIQANEKVDVYSRPVKNVAYYAW